MGLEVFGESDANEDDVVSAGRRAWTDVRKTFQRTNYDISYSYPRKNDFAKLKLCLQERNLCNETWKELVLQTMLCKTSGKNKCTRC